MDNKLAQLREQHKAKVEQDRQYSATQLTASQISNLEESMLKSFQLLVKFLEGHTSKTEVVNQLKSISTPDVDKVVRAVQTLNNTTYENKLDLTPIKDGLKALEDQLKLIPKEHAEAPEQREDVRVTNLNEIKIPELDTSKLEKAIKGLKLEAPVVNVPQAQVNVDAPDLKPIQKGFISLLDGIKAIKIPEVPVTDLSKVEKKLDDSNAKLQRLVDKPGPNLGPGTPYVEASTGKPLYVELTADGKVPVEAGATSTYQSFNDTTTDTNLVYLGKAVAGSDATDAAWQIKRYNKSAGTMTFADDITTFTKQWSARTGYTY